MIERPYQLAAAENAIEMLKQHRSTLLVKATGTGKTVVFSHVIRRRLEANPGTRAMVIAHREELIWQAANKIKRICGYEPDIEMAMYRADRYTLSGKCPVIVASIDSLNSGIHGHKRFQRFDPSEFSLIVIDEAHHAVAPKYRATIQHFLQNPDCRILGVTATPDRYDNKAMGQVFESVAFTYNILDAITDGYLTNIRQTFVPVSELDLSTVSTMAGDLNGKQLAETVDTEKVVLQMCVPTMEIAKDRKTLIFAIDVQHAKDCCEVFNRYRPGSAQYVTGKTPDDIRKAMFADYAAGKFQFLCNVGVATEGFDDPAIQCIAMFRPTKSRGLFTQMAGRGTRPLPGIVDALPDAQSRIAAIAASAKPYCEIIDFVGNSGQHKLISTLDILGGCYNPREIQLAERIIRDNGSMLPLEALEQARKLRYEEQQAQEKREAARRAAVKVNVNYQTRNVDPFDVLDIPMPIAAPHLSKKAPTEKMIKLLEQQGIDAEEMSFSEAGRLISEIKDRWDNNKCSYKQAKLLKRYGLDGDASREQAKQWIDAIVKNNWRLPASLKPQPAAAQTDIPNDLFNL